MPVFCEEGACLILCDSCKHYDFNGKNGAYTGKGWCRQFKKHEDPEGPGINCEAFHCNLAARKEAATT